MHNFDADENSPFAPQYRVRFSVTNAADTDLIDVYLIDDPNVVVAFLAKFLKEGVNP